MADEKRGAIFGHLLIRWMTTAQLREAARTRQASQEGTCAVGRSERSRLRKTATKPAEFGGPNRRTQTYYIIIIILKLKSFILILK
jgi:hypothetical protein